MAKFSVKYVETFVGYYDIDDPEVKTEEEAEGKLFDMIANGEVESPSYCIDSDFTVITRKE